MSINEYQKEALFLAKNSILEEFSRFALDGYKPRNIELLEKKSCFVTLRNSLNELRGCIGTIEPYRLLYMDIISNAKSAAFRDFRFSKITYDELADIYIEITILSPMHRISFMTYEKLLSYISDRKPGILIEVGNKRATFLPSVWKEVTDARDFILHLLQKAGIGFEEFLINFKTAKIYEYFGEEFGEYFDKID